MHTHTHTHKHTHTSIHTYLHCGARITCACTNTHIHVHTHSYIYLQCGVARRETSSPPPVRWQWAASNCTDIYSCVCICVCPCMNVCVFMCIFMCVKTVEMFELFTSRSTNMCIDTVTGTGTRTNTYTYTYIHTYTKNCTNPTLLSYVLSPFDQILKKKVLNSTILGPKVKKKRRGERKEWLHATTPDSERRRGHT